MTQSFKWFPSDGISNPAVGNEVILRRLVTRNGDDLGYYVTDPELRSDDHVANGANTSMFDGFRAIVNVRRNKAGEIVAVAVDRCPCTP